MNIFSDRELMGLGAGGWLLGIALMLGGLANWSWIPISFGALAFGFHDGRRHSHPVMPAQSRGEAS